MENRFHGLPPPKRFRLMQQEESPKNHLHNNVPIPSSCLPAKKRKENRDPSPFPPPPQISTRNYSLPAKKRIWAPPPLPLSSLDLNLEYNPSFDTEEPTQSKDVQKPIENNIQQLDTIVEEEEESFEDEIEEDGIVCAVCQSTDADPSNPIVFCDGCDLMVHTTCYGHPLAKGVPEGDWFCSQCLISKQSDKKSLSCCLCPISGGALKPTIDGKWAHIVCALFVPEVFFSDPEGREEIDCTKVPPRRWEQSCYVCETTKGCAIDCSEPKCKLAFHITCGFKEDLSIEYKKGKNKGAIVAGFCKRHTDLWKKQQAGGKFKIVAREEEHKK